MKKYKSTVSLNPAYKISSLDNSPLHNLAYRGNKSDLKKFLSNYSGIVDVLDVCGRTPLMYAVLADNRDCIISLIKAGAKVNAKDHFGRTALHFATECELYRCIKLLVACRADVRVRDNDGVAVLHLSSIQSSSQCLKQILQYYGPEEVDVQDNDKRTALHWSACCGNFINLKLLLKHNCNIGIPDVKGMTPLHWAAISQDPGASECVKYLVLNQPNVINWCDNDGQTAFHLAIAQNSRHVIEELISCRQGNVDVADNMFRTPLHLASLLGMSEIVDQLLSHNAHTSSCDVNGAMALHYAAASNSVEVASIILSKNVDVNQKDGRGRNAVAWAACTGANDVLYTLISNGADFRAVDDNGATALHLAVAYDHEKTVEILIDNGLSVNEVDASGRPPLFDACIKNRYSMVEYLIKYGAKRDHVDNDGRTALHCAAAKGHKEICQLLVSHGCEIDCGDNWGRTPLFCAVFGNSLYCVSYLIENGANPHHCDNEGFNSLHWASRKGHLEMVTFLLSLHVKPNTLKSSNRLTALDFACLGEHHQVAHYLLEHGALSMYHIENMAAAKIQRAYRKYRARIYKRQQTRELYSCPHKVDRDVLKDEPSGTKLSTCDHDCTLDKHRLLYDSPKSTEACQTNSSQSGSTLELNFSEDSFQFFQENPVATIHFNRKTGLKGSTSMINLGSSAANAHGNISTQVQIQPTALFRPQTFLRNEKKCTDRKTWQKTNKKRDFMPNLSGGDKSISHTFDDFVRSMNIDAIQEKMKENNWTGFNYGNCQHILSSSVQTLDDSDIPSWCFRNAVRNAAHREWLTACGSMIFNRSWAFENNHGFITKPDLK